MIIRHLISLIQKIFQSSNKDSSIRFPKEPTKVQLETAISDTPVVPVPHVEPFDLGDLKETRSFKDPGMKAMVEVNRQACAPAEPEPPLPDWARFAWKPGIVIGGLMTPVQMRNKVTELWGDEPPEYIWYFLGDHVATVEDMKVIAKRFFIGKEPSFGDIEFHISGVVYGAKVVRIRHADTLVVPAFLELESGDYCLYAVGHTDDPRTHYNFYCEAFI